MAYPFQWETEDRYSYPYPYYSYPAFGYPDYYPGSSSIGEALDRYSPYSSRARRRLDETEREAGIAEQAWNAVKAGGEVLGTVLGAAKHYAMDPALRSLVRRTGGDIRTDEDIAAYLQRHYLPRTGEGLLDWLARGDTSPVAGVLPDWLAPKEGTVGRGIARGLIGATGMAYDPLIYAAPLAAARRVQALTGARRAAKVAGGATRAVPRLSYLGPEAAAAGRSLASEPGLAEYAPKLARWGEEAVSRLPGVLQRSKIQEAAEKMLHRGYMASMGLGTVTRSGEAVEAAGEGDWQRAAEAGTEAAISGYMLGKHPARLARQKVAEVLAFRQGERARTGSSFSPDEPLPTDTIPDESLRAEAHDHVLRISKEWAAGARDTDQFKASLPAELQPYADHVLRESADGAESIREGRVLLDKIRSAYGDQGPIDVSVEGRTRNDPNSYFLVQRARMPDGTIRVVGTAQVDSGALKFITGGRAMDSPVSVSPLYQALDAAGVERTGHLSPFGLRARRKALGQDVRPVRRVDVPVEEEGLQFVEPERPEEMPPLQASLFGEEPVAAEARAAVRGVPKLRENRLWPEDLDKIPRGVLLIMDRVLKSRGFDTRGPDDIMATLKKRGGRFPVADWLTAYNEAAGFAERAHARASRHVDWDVVRGFPVTENPKAAGYINPDGELLDMSYGSGTRADDHRIVGGLAGVQELQNHGYVRWSPESNGIDLVREPTPAQYERIRDLAIAADGEVVLDLSRGLGEFDRSREYYLSPTETFNQQYPVGTRPGKILGDIRRFFSGEAMGPSEPEAMAQVGPGRREIGTTGFYSRLREVVDDPRTQAKQTGEQWLRFLSDPKRGVKAREIRETGIDEWLRSRSGERVTREEVQAYLEESYPRIREVGLGALGEGRAEYPNVGYNFPEGLPATYGERLIEAHPREKKVSSEMLAKRKAIFDEYMERIESLNNAIWNYTEYEHPLVQAEMARRGQEAEEAKAEMERIRLEQEPLHGQYVSNWPYEIGQRYNQLRAKTYLLDARHTAILMRNLLEAERDRRADQEVGPLPAEPARFIAPHFATARPKNLLVHTRGKSYFTPDPNGPSVLLPDGKVEKYTGQVEGTRGEYVGHIDEIQSDLQNALSKIKEDIEDYKKKGDLEAAEQRQKDYDELAAQVALSGEHNEVAVKRILKHAADLGYDRVTWTTGDQQVQRWKSAVTQAVDEILADKVEGGVQLRGLKGGKPITMRDPATGDPVQRIVVPEKDLHLYVGPGTAKNILDRLSTYAPPKPEPLPKKPRVRKPKQIGTTTVRGTYYGNELTAPDIPVYDIGVPGVGITPAVDWPHGGNPVIARGEYVITHIPTGWIIVGERAPLGETLRLARMFKERLGPEAGFGLDWTKADEDYFRNAPSILRQQVRQLHQDWQESRPAAERKPQKPKAMVVVSSSDLDIGGVGKRHVYDVILPGLFEKWSRKFGGGRVEDVELPIAGRGHRYEGPEIPLDSPRLIATSELDSRLALQLKDVKDAMARGMSFQAAMSEFGSPPLDAAMAFGGRFTRKGMVVHSVRLTPDVRERITTQGMPMYQIGERGAARPGQPIEAPVPREPRAEGFPATSPEVVSRTRDFLLRVYPDNTYIKQNPDGSFLIELPGTETTPIRRVIYRPEVDRVAIGVADIARGHGPGVAAEIEAGAREAKGATWIWSDIPHSAVVHILSGADPRVAIHEHWHVLRHLGNLSPEDITTLERAYPATAEGKRSEEVQADAFADWLSAQRPHHNFFTRIWDGIKALGRFITGEEVPEERRAGEAVFRRVLETGLAGPTQPRPIEAPPPPGTPSPYYATGRARPSSFVAVEVAPGEGSPRGMVWQTVPEDRRAGVTYNHVRDIADEAAGLSGVRILSRAETAGVWEQYQNPNVVFEAADPDTAFRFARIMARALHQTEVWAHQVSHKRGANAMGVDIRASSGYDFSRREDVVRFWNEALASEPGLGASAVTTNDGPVVRVIVDSNRDVQRVLGALDRWQGPELQARVNPIRVLKTTNDWRTDGEGQGHTRGLRGIDPAALDAFLGRSQESFDRRVAEAREAEAPVIEPETAAAVGPVPGAPPPATPGAPAPPQPQPQPPPPPPLSTGRATGQPPRVEQRVESLEEAITQQRRLGIPARDLILDRDARRTWNSFDPEIRRTLMEWDDDAFLKAMSQRHLADHEVQALDMVVRGRGEAKDQAFLDLQQARGTPDEGPAWARYQEALAKWLPLERANVNDGTGTARALAARARIMASAQTLGGMPPDRTFLRQLLRELPNISDADATRLVSMWERGDPQIHNALRAHLAGNGARFWTLYRANLLSIPSEFANVSGNSIVMGVELGDRAISAGVDYLLSKLKRTGRRERYVGEVAAEAGGMIQALPSALAQFARERLVNVYKRAWKGEGRPIRPGTPFEHQVSPFESKLGRLLGTPLDALSIADDAFQSINSAGALAGRSYRLAAQRLGKARGLDVASEAQRIAADALANPEKYPDLIASVRDASQRRVFRETPWKLVQDIQRLARNHQWLNIIVPFVRTPGNITRYAIRHSPLGFLQPEVWKAYSDFKADRISQGDLADVVAPRITGTLITAAVAGLYEAGLITGAGPSNPNERKALLRTGWQPYSFRVPLSDGTHIFVPYSRFDPIAQVIGSVADAAELENAKDANDALTRIAGSVASNLSNRLFLRGLMDFGNALSDPKASLGNWFSNVAQSVVPGTVDKLAFAFDPTYRETRPYNRGIVGLPERALRTMVSQVPGVSSVLPSRYGPTGEPAMRPGAGAGLLGAVARFVSPVIPTFEKPEAKLEAEMARVGYAPGETRQYLQIQGVRIPLRKDELDVVRLADEAAARELRHVITTGRWDVLPDTIEEGGSQSKEALIKKVYSKYRDSARQRLLRSRSFRSHARDVIQETRQ